MGFAVSAYFLSGIAVKKIASCGVAVNLNPTVCGILFSRMRYSWFAHDVISCHWAPSWLTLQITSAVCSEVLVSIYYFIVSFSVL